MDLNQIGQVVSHQTEPFTTENLSVYRDTHNLLMSKRRYRDLSGFPSVTMDVYDSLAATMASSSSRTDLTNPDDVEEQDYRKGLQMLAIEDLIYHNVPLFFLDPKFALAIEKTDLDMSFRASELKMPYDTMVFVLHKGTVTFNVDDATASTGITDAGRAECQYVMLYHNHAGALGIKMVGERLGVSPENTDNVYAFVPVFELATANGSSFIHSTKLIYDDDDTTIDESLTAFNSVSSGTAASARACRIAVGAIMAMTCRPDLLTKETIHHWQHKDPRKRGNVAFWNPNIIGNGYQISGGPGNGSHASPRMHWRRGHFRNQACGHGRRDHRRVWLEPMLVAATHKEDSNVT